MYMAKAQSLCHFRTYQSQMVVWLTDMALPTFVGVYEHNLVLYSPVGVWTR